MYILDIHVVKFALMLVTDKNLNCRVAATLKSFPYYYFPAFEKDFIWKESFWLLNKRNQVLVADLQFYSNKKGKHNIQNGLQVAKLDNKR